MVTPRSSPRLALLCLLGFRLGGCSAPPEPEQGDPCQDGWELTPVQHTSPRIVDLGGIPVVFTALGDQARWYALGLDLHLGQLLGSSPHAFSSSEATAHYWEYPLLVSGAGTLAQPDFLYVSAGRIVRIWPGESAGIDLPLDLPAELEIGGHRSNLRTLRTLRPVPLFWWGRALPSPTSAATRGPGSPYRPLLRRLTGGVRLWRKTVREMSID